MAALIVEGRMTDPIQFIEWGAAARPIKGETVSGDAFTIVPLEDGILIGVADGLGHGAAAAAASRAAMETLKSSSHKPLETLIQDCHSALRSTRGAVMAVAAIRTSTGTLSWLGIGNVEGILLSAPAVKERAPVWLRSIAGTVGLSLPKISPVSLHLAGGDTLIFATDGVERGLSGDLGFNAPPQEMADRILERQGKLTDDVLVLVVRWKG